QFLDRDVTTELLVMRARDTTTRATTMFPEDPVAIAITDLHRQRWRVLRARRRLRSVCATVARHGRRPGLVSRRRRIARLHRICIISQTAGPRIAASPTAAPATLVRSRCDRARYGRAILHRCPES